MLGRVSVGEKECVGESKCVGKGVCWGRSVLGSVLGIECVGE